MANIVFVSGYMFDSLISIIVPVYNSENTLRRCVDSILAQTYQNFELLLIDDGSKDCSGEICDEYATIDSRVRVFHQENRGVSSARNVGLDNAYGEWITFCDSDDYLEVDALKIYSKYASLLPNVSIIRAGYKSISTYCSKDVSCKELSIIDCNSNVFFVIEKTQYYGFLWNSLFRSKEIENIRFDKDICWSEDHIFSAKAYLACKTIAFIPEVVYNHFMHETGSLSSPKDPYMLLRAANAEFLAKKSLYDRDVLPMPDFCVAIYRHVLLWSINTALLNFDRQGVKKYIEYFSTQAFCDDRVGKLLHCLRLKHIPFFVKWFLCKWKIYDKV